MISLVRRGGCSGSARQGQGRNENNMNIIYRQDGTGLLWQFPVVISTQEDIKNVICTLKVLIIEIDSGIFNNERPNNYY